MAGRFITSRRRFRIIARMYHNLRVWVLGCSVAGRFITPKRRVRITDRVFRSSRVSTLSKWALRRGDQYVKIWFSNCHQRGLWLLWLLWFRTVTREVWGLLSNCHQRSPVCKNMGPPEWSVVTVVYTNESVIFWESQPLWIVVRHTISYHFHFSGILPFFRTPQNGPIVLLVKPKWTEPRS